MVEFISNRLKQAGNKQLTILMALWTLKGPTNNTHPSSQVALRSYNIVNYYMYIMLYLFL